MNSRVIDYIVEEVRRQGHDVNSLDGIERVGWMTDAWSYAIGQAMSEDPDDRVPCVIDIIAIGQMVERRKNKNGFRKCPMRVGTTPIRVDPKDVKRMITELCEDKELMKRPLDFYRAYEEIHAFLDGNGRSGKILLNWLRNGSSPCGGLLEPVFPPDDFWGRPILNP